MIKDKDKENNEMAQAEDVKEILDGRREFTVTPPDEEPKTYYISNPTGEDVRKAEWRYAKVYNQAIVDDFLTQSQMLDLLKKKGVIGQEYTDQIEAIRTALATELFKLENLTEGAEDEEREAIAMEVAQLRDELFQLNQRVNSPLSNCCENLAEDARAEFLTSRLVENKDGSKVWASFEDFQKEENSPLAIQARFEVMLWMQGLESNFLENTPERTVLRDIAQRRIDIALEKLEEQQKEEDAKEVEEIPLEAEEKKEEPAKETEEASKEKSSEEKASPKKKRGRPKKDPK